MGKVNLGSPCIVRTELSPVVCFVVGNSIVSRGNIKKQICECLLGVWWRKGGIEQNRITVFLSRYLQFPNASCHIKKKKKGSVGGIPGGSVS